MKPSSSPIAAKKMSTITESFQPLESILIKHHKLLHDTLKLLNPTSLLNLLSTSNAIRKKIQQRYLTELQCVLTLTDEPHTSDRNQQTLQRFISAIQFCTYNARINAQKSLITLNIILRHQRSLFFPQGPAFPLYLLPSVLESHHNILTGLNFSGLSSTSRDISPIISNVLQFSHNPNSRLKSLDLSGLTNTNSLRKQLIDNLINLNLPQSSIHHLSLRQLNINDDDLNTLSPILHHIITLNLADNLISFKGIRHITNALQRHDNQLTSLDISGNKNCDHRCLTLFSTAFRQFNTRLKYLNIAGCALSQHCIEMKNKTASSLSVSPSALAALAALGHNGPALHSTVALAYPSSSENNNFTNFINSLTLGFCQLQHLHIDLLNQLGPKALKLFSSYLTNRYCSLSSLTIEHTHFDIPITQHLFNNQTPSTTRNIKKLSFHQCVFPEQQHPSGQTNFEVFTRGVFFLLQPNFLDLSRNQLNQSHAHTLSFALEQPESSIQSLVLDFNSFSSGIQHIATSLTKPKNPLRFISLNHCALGDNEIDPLFNALKNSHCRLKSLSLNNNLLTANIITRMIQSLHAIQGKSIHINIDHNIIPLNQDLHKIKQSIKQNSPTSPTLSLSLQPFNGNLFSQNRHQHSNATATTVEQKTPTTRRAY